MVEFSAFWNALLTICKLQVPMMMSSFKSSSLHFYANNSKNFKLTLGPSDDAWMNLFLFNPSLAASKLSRTAGAVTFPIKTVYITCTDPVLGSIPKSNQNLHLFLTYNFTERFIKSCDNKPCFIQKVQQSICLC